MSFLSSRVIGLKIPQWPELQGGSASIAPGINIRCNGISNQLCGETLTVRMVLLGKINGSRFLVEV